ncbi:YybH family protein [Nocardia sp. NPDC052566]|uniref:YybH family protein n=1 Tax=Nocardia sp. NPDC052566 TaxID=3364330 RepID=UPI0037CB57BB
MTTNHDHDSLTRFIARWVELFNARDLTALAELYEPGSVMVPTPGQLVTGPERAVALASLSSLGVPMAARLHRYYLVGDIALLLVDWSLEGNSPDGRAIALRGIATDVVHRDTDGDWRYVIDNPSGTAEFSAPPH